MLKINLQRFADGQDDGEDAGSGAATKQTSKPQGKVWTDDYVMSLREEAKNHRLRAKSAEATLRSLIGLKDDEDITETRIVEYKQRLEADKAKAIDAANSRLIAAELKAVQGYDVKLVERLIDRSKIAINDKGEITGLKEALEALATEFPQVKAEPGKASEDSGAGAGAAGGNPPPDNTTKLAELEERLAKATALEEKIALRQEIFQAQQKK